MVYHQDAEGERSFITPCVPAISFVGKVRWVLESVRGREAPLAAYVAALGCKLVWELVWLSTSTVQLRVKWEGV